MAEVTYRIELRQIDVKALNARHYFWVKTRVTKDPTNPDKSKQETVAVLDEIHGFPFDREMGHFRNFSMGGDQLKMSTRSDQISAFGPSQRLPHVVAVEKSSREEIDARWDVGKAMGKFVNKTGINYDPLGDNSNAMTTTVGKAMGLRPRKILDPRVGGEAVQPFTPSLGRDLAAGRPDAPRSTFSAAPKDVGGFGQLDRRIDGTEQTLDPFADPFRTDTPF
ncbi:MAG TPA: hypothetical protein VM325_07115 [Alphaproteobacteria bacterium]|nr:hypothetical protein [Alphaproteobacteria bacterium]